MKTKLPKKSFIIKERLDEIVQEILAVAEKEIAMIILFGSYAKGTAVISDRYVEDGILYSYESDVDIMVVPKSSRYRGFQGRLLQSKLGERLASKGLYYKPKITFIIEPIERVNKELEKSQYFFSDIKKEGVMLYNSGEFQLAEPRDLCWKERKEIAKDDFEQWFDDASAFLRDTYHAVQHIDFRRGAFYLHQATESLYSTILLVFSGYKPRLHDIEILGSLSSNYSDELLKIFPRDTKELKDRFILLQEAYIRARYDKTYKVTEEICQAWINK